MGLQDSATFSEERGMSRQCFQPPGEDHVAHEWRLHRLPWWIAILVLASACSGAYDPASSPSISPRTTETSSGSVDPLQRANLQMRRVIEIVTPTSANWAKKRLTCSGQGDVLNDCVASKLDAVRIVLLRPEDGWKYVLGPVIVDETDVEQATAQLEQQADLGWSISIELTADAADAFQAATEKAAGSLDPQNEIAAVIDGRIVSTPTVLVPITGGEFLLQGRFTESEAKTLAASLIGSAPA
jgi:preprotein translocase subunit SecD